MDARRTWEPPRPAVPRRADHTAIVGCDLIAGGVAVESPGAAADLPRLREQARERDGAFVRLGLHEPTPAALRRVADVFGLPPQAVEDILHREQRVRIEQHDDVMFLVVRVARYRDHEPLSTGFVHLFVGADFVVTVRQGTVLDLGAPRVDPALLAQGPWAVVHAILDHLVDDYTEIAAAMRTDIDLTEAAVLASGTRVTVEEIYQLKRQLMRFRTAVLPLQRPLAALAGKHFAGLPRESRRYFADVADHHAAAVDQVVALDHVVNALLQAHLAQLNVDQNNDLRKIASWAAIAALPTALAGVYGMNFAHMPELDSPYGYPGVLLFLLLSAVLLHRLLRRAGWL